MILIFVALFAGFLQYCNAQCTFCLPACTQALFPGSFCSSSILSVKATVVSNDTTVCTGVCDGKGIALGNLKTVYKIRVRRVLKNSGDGAVATSVAGIRTFATDPQRMGVRMDVGKEYFINLLEPLPLDGIDEFPYIDRCDHPVLWSDLTQLQITFLLTYANTGVAVC